MSAAGARMAARAVMQALGGTGVLVRLPSPPLANTALEELGLPAPEFRDVALPCCVVRAAKDGTTVLADAQTLETALGVSDVDAAQAALVSAAFVQVGGNNLLLRGVDVGRVGDSAYLYRLRLRVADAEVLP